MTLFKIPSMATMMVCAALFAKVQSLTLQVKNCPNFTYLAPDGVCRACPDFCSLCDANGCLECMDNAHIRPDNLCACDEHFWPHESNYVKYCVCVPERKPDPEPCQFWRDNAEDQTTADASCVAIHGDGYVFNLEKCHCYCKTWVDVKGNQQDADATCNLTSDSTFIFDEHSCSCKCPIWEEAAESQLAADIKCENTLGAGYRFDAANCKCVYVPPTQVTITFVSCNRYLLLDTDYNLPSFDTYLKEKKTVFGDPCSDSHGNDYGLRQVGTPVNPFMLFNIFPVAGEAPNVVYIQGVSRRNYCSDRSFLQWTEESCQLSTPYAKSASTQWWNSSYHDLAHVSMAGEDGKSKWELDYGQGLNCQRNYIKPFNVPASSACANKYLSLGSSGPTGNPLQIGIGAKNNLTCQVKLLVNGVGQPWTPSTLPQRVCSAV